MAVLIFRQMAVTIQSHSLATLRRPLARERKHSCADDARVSLNFQMWLIDWNEMEKWASWAKLVARIRAVDPSAHREGQVCRQGRAGPTPHCFTSVRRTAFSCDRRTQACMTKAGWRRRSWKKIRVHLTSWVWTHFTVLWVLGKAAKFSLPQFLFLAYEDNSTYFAWLW